MNIAISGNRQCCLTQQLGDGIYLFAVANGFGHIGSEEVAALSLSWLRSDFQRRAQNDRLRRAAARPKNVTAALLAALTKINEELHARTASHEDYVSAACSMTAVLLIDERAYIAHIGSTAAYLARDGYIVGLTKNDAFESEGALPILHRALGSQGIVEIGVCAFTLTNGDALVLAGHRLGDLEQRRRLAESLSHRADPSAAAQALIVRYAETQEPMARAQVPAAGKAHHAPSILMTVLATILFYALLSIG